MIIKHKIDNSMDKMVYFTNLNKLGKLILKSKGHKNIKI